MTLKFYSVVCLDLFLRFGCRTVSLISQWLLLPTPWPHVRLRLRLLFVTMPLYVGLFGLLAHCQQSAKGSPRLANAFIMSDSSNRHL